MSTLHSRFLPERLRPRAPRRRSHRRVLLPAAAAMILMVLAPGWRIERVEVAGAEVVPGSVAASLEGLVGHAVLLLDLEWTRWVAAVWPDAARGAQPRATRDDSTRYRPASTPRFLLNHNNWGRLF